MSKMDEAQSRLTGANEKLQWLKDAVQDIKKADGPIRRKGAMNAGSWAYAIEQIIRKLKGLNRADFDQSFAPKLKNYLADPIVTWWLTLRRDVIHDNPPPFTLKSTYINYLGPNEMIELRKNAPPGSTGMFIGDEIGGSGWTIPGEDNGSPLKIYFQLPEKIGKNTVNFSNPPDGKSLEKLADALAKLTENILKEATTWVSKQK